MDDGSAQCVPGGTRLAQLGAQLENAIANGVSPDRFAWRRSASKRFGRTKIRVLYALSAKRIQGHELPSAQKDRPLPQTAVPADPVANRRGIGGDHLASRFGSEIFSTVVVDQPRRMKTQDRPSSDADPIMRDRAQDKRAGRITGTVDDDAFSGMPQHGKKLEIMTDFPSSTGFDPHFA